MMTTIAAPAARTVPAWATTYTARALTALPADLTTATPPQIDEMLRTVELETVSITARRDRAVEGVRYAIGQEPTTETVGHGLRRETRTVWPTRALYAVDQARALDPATPTEGYHARYRLDLATVGDALVALDAVLADRQEALELLRVGGLEFSRRGGWSRYYRVDNSNGHVHTSTACRTCYDTTQFTWPTDLSGADGAAVVDAAGSLTCLTCFPDEREDILAGRPVRWEAFETVEAREVREVREAERAAKVAAKIAKAVTADGSPLTVRFPRPFRGFDTAVLKTERAAELRYVELAAEATYGEGRRYNAAALEVLGTAIGEVLAALAWKRGTTAQQVAADLAPKVARKARALY